MLPPPLSPLGKTRGFLFRAPAVSIKFVLEARELKDLLERMEARIEFLLSKRCSARCLDFVAQKATQRITKRRTAAEQPNSATVRASSVHPKGSSTR